MTTGLTRMETFSIELLECSHIFLGFGGGGGKKIVESSDFGYKMGRWGLGRCR